MNFTKDYISLCKNPEVQGLKYIFDEGDWYLSGENNNPKISRYNGQIWNHHTWLPTGDQLDQCIIEQLDDGSDYTFIYTNYSKEAGHYNAIVYEGGEVKEQITGETNPLICKLKLLISLLEEEE
jgi:hypothetical protein